MKIYQIPELDELPYPIGKELKPLIKFIKDVVKIIKNNNILPLDLPIKIWVRGSSGAILSGILCTKLMTICKKNSITIKHIKKPGEYSHDVYKPAAIESSYNIVIDDFVSTGDTMEHIQETLNKHKVPKVNLLILSSTGLSYDEDTDCDRDGNYHTLQFKHFTPETLIVGHIDRPFMSCQSQQQLIEILEKLQPTKIF